MSRTCVVLAVMILLWGLVLPSHAQITRSFIANDQLNIPTNASGVAYPITARAGAGSACTDVTLNTAITAIGATRATLPLVPRDGGQVACTWTLGANVTTNANTFLVIEAPVVVNAGFTLTINGPWQSTIGPNWYSGDGTVTINFRDWSVNASSSYIVSGCAPSVPGASLTFDPFACRGNIVHNNDWFHVNQAAASVGPLNAGNGTYWLALHRDTGTAVAGWTRQAGTHYLWQLSAAQPATPSGGYIFNRVTVVASVIATVRRIRSPRLDGWVTPDMYGALGGVNDDTVPVQDALAGDFPVVFAQTYRVTLVTISGIERRIDFSGFSLIGVAAVPTDAVLHITARLSRLYNISVNQNFNANYTSAVRWHSVLPEASQVTNVYGMFITNATYGLVYGAQFGFSSVAAPQDPNIVYGFTVRAVQIPFFGNQTSGRIQLVGPMLDCAPSEWTSQPGYNATTFATAAMAFRNDVGRLEITGGDIIKTTGTLGYLLRGKGFLIDGSTLESATTYAYLTGNATIQNNGGGFLAGDTAPAFIIENGTANGSTLTLQGFTLSRLLTVPPISGYSAALFAQTHDGGVASYTLSITDSVIFEWRWANGVPFAGAGIYLLLKDVKFTGNVNALLNYPGESILESDPTGHSFLSALGVLTPQGGWTYNHVSGGGTFGIQQVLATSGEPFRTAIQFVETGDSTLTTSVGTRGFLLANTTPYLLGMWSSSSTGQTVAAKVYFYNEAGTGIGDSGTLSFRNATNLQEQIMLVVPTAGAVYGALEIRALGAQTAKFSNIRLVPAGTTAGQPTTITPQRVLTATATLDFPDIATGTTSDLTISVPGAVTGIAESVSLGIEATCRPAGNAKFEAWVSSANVVTVRVFNDTGGNFNVAPCLFRATVLKY